MTGLREKYIGCLPAVTFVRRAADGAPLKEREKQMSLSVQHLQFNTTTLFYVHSMTFMCIVCHYFSFSGQASMESAVECTLATR